MKLEVILQDNCCHPVWRFG